MEGSYECPIVIEDDSDDDDVCKADVASVTAHEPEGVDDANGNCLDVEIKGSLQFIDNYTASYGQTGPQFFAGTFDEAVREAFLKPPLKKRLLGVYLHNGTGLLTNVFCTQVLADKNVLELLKETFVVWGWDVTDLQNRMIFHRAAEKYFGTNTTRLTTRLYADDLPVFAVLSHFGSNTELRRIIYGNASLEEFYSGLNEVTVTFQIHMCYEYKEEQARLERETLKSVQDEAYRESLEIDRAKVEAKRMKLIEETEERERLERETKELEETRKRERILVESQMENEPTNSSQHVITIKFRASNGEGFKRKFHASDSLGHLFDFLLVKGYRHEEHRLFSVWPKRELSVYDCAQRLDNLGLKAQETIVLERR